MNVIKRLCYFSIAIPTKGMSYSVRHQFLRRNRFTFSQNIQNIHTCDGQITEISTDEIKSKIKTRWKYSEGHTSIRINCPSCYPSEAMSDVAELSKLFINSKTGNLFCTQCFLHGPWQMFDTYLQAMNRSIIENGVNSNSPRITDFLSSYQPNPLELEEMKRCWESAESVDSIPEEELASFLDTLHLKVIKKRTLMSFGAKINLELKQLIFPIKLSMAGKCIGLKIITPNNLKKLEESEGTTFNEQNLPKNHPWLLGYQFARNQENVVITATAADALVIMQNFSVPALCLPSLSQLSLATLAYLEPFRRITLWLDQNLITWDLSRIFAKKTGEDRCFLIRPTATSPSPLQCLRQGKDIRKIITGAKPILHKAVTTFASLRDEVYAEVLETHKSSGVRWRRFPILTELLKGHRRGELTIFTGPTGAGKTTFISEYSLDLCMQNVTTLWGSFEIRNTRLIKMMLQQFNGAPLPQNAPDFTVIADEFEQLPMYYLTFHGHQNVKAVLDAMGHATYVHDISHIIIDNLQFMMGTSDPSTTDRFYQQDSIIGLFRQFATLNNVHITLVIHPRKEDGEELTTSSIFGGAKASQEADNVLILQDKRLADPSHRRKYLQVCKNRYTGDLGVMPLEFHKDSLSFSQRKKNQTFRGHPRN